VSVPSIADRTDLEVWFRPARDLEMQVQGGALSKRPPIEWKPPSTPSPSLSKAASSPATTRHVNGSCTKDRELPPQIHLVGSTIETPLEVLGDVTN
jgi:hypothetical protein